MKYRATVLLMTFGLAAGATACGPDVPARPDWANDVRPILQARCVRCHVAPKRMDPLVADQGTPAPLNQDAASPLSGGFVAGLLIKVRGSATLVRMPPPPNAPLEDWQIQILENYSKTAP